MAYYNGRGFFKTAKSKMKRRGKGGLCPECKKPDTKLEKEGRVIFIRCMACGAKHPVKSKF